jgi:hypothetical protein
MKQAIDERTSIRRIPDLLETEVDGDVVALDVERGECYGLDAVGTDIWKLLAEDTSISEITDTLLEQYEIDRETCLREVSRIVSELQESELLVVSGSAPLRG